MSRFSNSKVSAIEINDDLECPVCLEVAVSPINTCKKGGHIVCGICKDKTAKCPTCQDENLTVNEFVERILRSKGVELPCRNLQHGCTLKVKPCEMKDHLTTSCDFRFVVLRSFEKDLKLLLTSQISKLNLLLCFLDLLNAWNLTKSIVVV